MVTNTDQYHIKTIHMRELEPLVYKSSELIEAQYDLSAAAQKVAAALISRIDPTSEKPLPVFDMTVTEYCDLIGVSRQAAYAHLEKVTIELKRIVITLREHGSKSYRRLGMFRQCEYVESLDDQGHRVLFEFEDRLDSHLRDFAGNFTSYQVRQIRKLRSQYSIRLYELLRKSHPVATRRGVSYRTIDLEALRAMIGATKTYKKFSDFRKFILEVAQKELSEKTDISFGFQSIRKGRAIGAIRFTINHNFFDGIDPPDSETCLKVKIRNIFPDRKRSEVDELLEYIFEAYDEDRIERNYRFTIERSVAGGKKINHKGAFLMNAIKNDLDAESSRESLPLKGVSLFERLTDRSWDNDLNIEPPE